MTAEQLSADQLSADRLSALQIIGDSDYQHLFLDPQYTNIV